MTGLLDFKSMRNSHEFQVGNNFRQYASPMDWSGRLRERMQELGWNMAELSRRSGIPYDSINNGFFSQNGGKGASQINTLADFYCRYGR